MTTFNELVKMNTTDNLTFDETITMWELKAANRSYMTDNLNPRTMGNHLDDFLAAHGDEEIRPIKFYSGSAMSAGEGIVFLGAIRLFDEMNNFVEELTGYRAFENFKADYKDYPYSWVETQEIGKAHSLPWTYKYPFSLDANKNVRAFGGF